jgi:hypothetical protein
MTCNSTIRLGLSPKVSRGLWNECRNNSRLAIGHAEFNPKGFGNGGSDENFLVNEGKGVGNSVREAFWLHLYRYHIQRHC